jgi:HD-GYP domain-containing protein (c-di-GMP phosphodiesterase class II)
MDASPRLAELVGGLSLATDLVAGLAEETALRCAWLAARLAREVGLADEERSVTFYAALLRFIGCTAFAHETAWTYGAGDDAQVLRALTPADAGRPVRTLATVVTRVGAGAPLARRARAVAAVLRDPAMPRELAAAHCALATRLASRLGMAPGVVEALGQIYERFDGRGHPRGLRGEALAVPVRLLHVAFRAEVHRASEGSAAALREVRARSGGELDPALVRPFLRRGEEWLATVSTPVAWDLFLEAEPPPLARVDARRLDDVAVAFAQYADVKSPYTLGHSTGVAELADAAAERLGLAAAERQRLRIAALLHDLGRTAIPNGLWDKPGPLTAAEWERVRGHAACTDRVLRRSSLLAPYASTAAVAHERLDGSGYPGGRPAGALDPAARLLAAADVYRALREPRAWRPAYDPEDAARHLREEVEVGRLERVATGAVLAAAGAPAPPRVSRQAAELSDREVEVLRLLARGLTNAAIGKALFIAPATVKRHVENIYARTGTSSRATAAVFAVEHGLA